MSDTNNNVSSTNTAQPVPEPAKGVPVNKVAGSEVPASAISYSEQREWDEEHERIREETTDWEDVAPPRIQRFNLTQRGNAERLVDRFGPKIRYCHTWGRWLIWDGQRWKRDTMGQIQELAVQTVRMIPRESTGAVEAGRTAILGHAKRSERASELSAMVDLAQSMIGIESKDLDSDPFVFNCRNGILDLRTGQLRKHDPGALLTNLSPVEYIKDAPCPRWQQFLEEVFAGKKKLISYMQRALGCALTGVPEKAVFFLIGNGDNGKTTMLEVFRYIIGEYAWVAEINLLMQRATNNEQQYAVAALEGKRFVTTSEAKEGEQLNEAKLKEITGRQTLQARNPYGSPFQFYPQYKLFVDANYKPVVQGTDDGIWGRLQAIPFNVKFAVEPKEGELPMDKQLPATLRAEASGILAWAVEGCLQWQRHGLGVPTVVQEAVTAYREEMDFVAEFIAECCIEDPAAETSSTDLYPRFVQWNRQRGVWRPLPSPVFGARLEGKGFKAERTKTYRFRRGLRMKPLGEDVKLPYVP
jgi:putative DNA primase/helicase